MLSVLTQSYITINERQRKRPNGPRISQDFDHNNPEVGARFQKNRKTSALLLLLPQTELHPVLLLWSRPGKRPAFFFRLRCALHPHRLGPVHPELWLAPRTALCWPRHQNSRPTSHLVSRPASQLKSELRPGPVRHTVL